jgi:hypothetical protein
MTDEHTITFSAMAMDNLAYMRDEIFRLENLLGKEHPLAVRAQRSLVLSLTQMIALKPERVHAEDSLSLYGITERGFVFGVNYCGASHNEHGAGEWSVNS